MSEFFDETFEEQESREKFEYFFGQYSAEVRKNLLSKNIKKPENLYDVLYTKVRRDLLAKNETTFNVDLDENARIIRDTLLFKHAESQVNLDLTGDNYRQTQLSKNNLLQSSLDLSKISESVRENLLSKNVESDVNLDERARQSRNNNISNNVEKTINLDQNADIVRENLLSKNKEDNINLDASATPVRDSLLSSNVKSKQDIDNDSIHLRNVALSKNKENEVNLDKQAEQYRGTQLSKNDDNETNLDLSATSIRGTQLSKNKESEQSIDAIAESARKLNESNNVDSTKNIEAIGDSARSNMESKNNDSEISIDAIANKERGREESKNKEIDINLDNKSSFVRENMLSSNKENPINLDKNSEIFRENLLSNNKENPSSVESVGDVVRNSLLSNNKENPINLDGNSEPVRDNLLSANKPVDINLDKNSEAPRSNLLASNKPIDIDLDKSAETPRDNLLASNVPTNIDLDKSSETPRNNLLASNVDANIDLDKDSINPRKNLLASNVPANIDLDKDSIEPRKNLLASNVPSDINLDAISGPPRGTLLAANAPKDINLDTNSIDPRNHLINSNVPKNINLDLSSIAPRNNLLSSNTPKTIDLDSNSNQVRDNLLAANVDTPNQMEDIAGIFRHDLLTKNDKSTGLGTNVFLAGTSLFIGVSNLEIISAPIREIMKFRGKASIKNSTLQSNYGLQTNVIGEASSKITKAAQLYNLQKNPFMGVRYLDKESGYEILLNHNTGGFQEMLALGNKLNSARALETNTTPASVITENVGVYVGLPTNVDGTSPVTSLLKPGGFNAKLGTAESMMANTVPSDMIAVNFNKNERGVVRIVNTIRKDTSIAMAKNYDSQNNKSFIIGTNPDGSNKLAYARYTIANPYQPNVDAGTLEFRIKNYAIYNGNKKLVHTMSFPPYIKSFTNSDSANWNKVDYLGRPEPIYTYSNSNREGSLSFYVLTDFSQEVDMGFNYEKQEASVETFNKRFTEQVDTNDKSTDIDAEINDKESQIVALNEQLTASEENDVSGSAVIKKRIAELQKEISSLESKQKEISTGKSFGSKRGYKEYDTINGNVYKTLINNGAVRDTGGNINLQTESTKERLTRMKKDLLFQPAFFSGDKVDFLTRMEFIAKLTRPARNTSNRGFSFTFPPVCHLHLGDWFNHDVIINNVSYDYSDAPWTIDGQGGRTQPMWALVTLSFNIVGTYESNPGQDVPLSTDIGGFFQKKQKSTGSK